MAASSSAQGSSGPDSGGDPARAAVRPRACSCCGLVQAVPRLVPGLRASCARCSTPLSGTRDRVRKSWPGLTFHAALAALILYPLAISLPIMRLERFGHVSDASIWTGSVGLLSEGELFVGGVVLVCSVLLPLGKLGSLLLITSRGVRGSHAFRVAGAPSGSAHKRARTWARTWRVVELTGRWGMLDVLLISVVVAWIKIGDLVEVTPGPAALAFTACVLLSLVASAAFDPHALWQEECG